MRTTHLTLLAAALLAPLVGGASSSEVSLTEVEQELRAPKNIISVAPVSLATGAIGAEYERALARSISLTFSADYRYLAGSPGEGQPHVEVGFLGMNVGAHIFLWGKAPTGLWLGPELGVIFAGGRQGDTLMDSANMPRTALQLGYTGLIANLVSVSVGAGVQTWGKAVLPSGRASVGLAF